MEHDETKTNFYLQKTFAYKRRLLPSQERDPKKTPDNFWMEFTAFREEVEEDENVEDTLKQLESIDGQRVDRYLQKRR